MKLVDILARDLDLWPEKVVALSQDSDGYVGGISADELEEMTFCAGDWSSVADGYLEAHELSDDYSVSIVTREQWQAAVDALKRGSPALHVQVAGRGKLLMPWNGDGLPPVGANVESKDFGGVTVLAHGIFRGQTVIICQGDDTVITCTPDQLTPIRTAEQIAADERAADIDKMVQFFMNYYSNPKGAGQYLLICRSLYDAGYRKQPK